MIIRLPQINSKGEVEEIMLNTRYIIHASGGEADATRTEVAIDQRSNGIVVWIAMSYEEFAAKIDDVQRQEMF
jgi:hypothetical protein